MLQGTNQTTKTTKYTYAQKIIDTNKDIHKISTSALVFIAVSIWQQWALKG